MDPSFPIYGSILKIKDEKSKFENTLFFVQYISKEKIILISNQGLEMVELAIGADGKFEDKDIEELQIIYQPNAGYAQQNNMKKGSEVVILMNDEEQTEFNGVIEDVIEDMIVVKIKSDEEFVFYIDFQYCGLDEKYGIKKIQVKHSKPKMITLFLLMKKMSNKFKLLYRPMKKMLKNMQSLVQSTKKRK